MPKLVKIIARKCNKLILKHKFGTTIFEMSFANGGNKQIALG
jgi:hypothetical protein